MNERTWFDILPFSETQSVADDTLTRHQVIVRSLNLLTLPSSPTQRSNSVRISETDDSEPCDHSSARVSSRRRLHDLPHGSEDVFGVDTELARLLESVGKEIEEKFRVGGSVDMAMGVVVEVVLEVSVVGEVTVLRREREYDVEELDFL